MNIFYQSDSFFYLVRKNDNTVVKKRVYKKIDKILEDNTFVKTKNYFLLEENNFLYYSLNIELRLDNKITIVYLKKLINNKILYLKSNYNINWKKLLTSIDNIQVGWESKKYLIWEKWYIKFLLNIIFLKSDCLNLFESHFWWSFINNLSFEILPKSFYTLYFIKNILWKNNFNVLYILEDKIKLLKVKNGFYNDFVSIENLGFNMLKSIYKENNILQYLFTSNISNDFVKDLSLKSLDFYNNILIEWLNENLEYSWNLLLLSDLNKNTLFVNDFVKKYKTKINWYFLPLNSFDILNKFNFNWNCDEIDLLTFLNNTEFL